MAHWTIGSLSQALETSEGGVAGDLRVRRIEGADPVLMVTMASHGDLPIFLSLAGEQIVVSTLLWPVSEQEDREAFNHFLLKAQKMVPLSNFAIAEVDGVEYYELIGELSAQSGIDMVLLELGVLAENAIDAADELRAGFAETLAA